MDYYSANYNRGVLAIIGNLLVNISVGEVNLLGFLYPYFVSYFRITDPTVTLKSMKIIPMCWLLVQIVSCPLGIFTYMKFGFKLTYLIFLTTFCLVQFLSSYIQNHLIFCIVYGVSGGLSQGALMILPLYCGWRYFREKYKPRIAGILVSAYAIAPLFMSQIALYLINPNNEREVQDEVTKQFYFEESVAQNVPYFLRFFGIFCFVLGLAGVFLIWEPVEGIVDLENAVMKATALGMGSNRAEEIKANMLAKREGKKMEGITKQSFGDAIKCFYKKEFMILFSICLVGFIYPHMMNFCFKDIGMRTLNDDHFVTFAGSIGALVNGASRLVVGFLMEKYPYYKIMIGIILLEVLASQTFLIFANFRYSYILGTAMFEMTYGGQLGITPLICDKLFKDKGAITYSYILSAFTFSLIVSLSFYTEFVDEIGQTWLFLVVGVVSALNYFLVDMIKDYEKGEVGKEENETALEYGIRLEDYRQMNTSLRKKEDLGSGSESDASSDQEGGGAGGKKGKGQFLY